MAKYNLVSYDQTSAPAITIDCELNATQESIFISFKLQGELSCIDLGEAVPHHARVMKLWEKSCFELFIKNAEGSYNADGIDQITNVINQIKTNPNSRRLIVSGWNPCEAEQVALPPCHTLFQFFVADNKLSCQLYQRSADLFLGVPFNIASYALLTQMVAQVCDLEVGEFIWTGGDCHIYQNHREQVELQLTRSLYTLPTLTLNPNIKDIFAFTYEDISVDGYESHPAIKAPVAV